MPPRIIRLPNGHVTHSGRISRVRILADRSPDPTQPFLEIYEAGRLVYRGLMDLREQEAPGPVPATAV